MNLKIAACTDAGIRKQTNQDSVLVKTAQTDYGRICLASVCDGMGGLAKGELASATAVRFLSGWFENELPGLLCRKLHMEALEAAWRDLIDRINGHISAYSREAHISMGTTMVVLLIVGHTYYIVNVGDSRVYLLRDEPAQLTRDQTFIQREVDEGRMTREAARRDSRRNLLLQCVGALPYIEPVFGSGDIFSGSMFLLCSDGFCHVITQEEIFRHLAPSRLPDEAAMQERLAYLIALDKYRGEPDNISAVLIRCD